MKTNKITKNTFAALFLALLVLLIISCEQNRMDQFDNIFPEKKLTVSVTVGLEPGAKMTYTMSSPNKYVDSILSKEQFGPSEKFHKDIPLNSVIDFTIHVSDVVSANPITGFILHQGLSSDIAAKARKGEEPGTYVIRWKFTYDREDITLDPVYTTEFSFKSEKISGEIYTDAGCIVPFGPTQGRNIEIDLCRSAKIRFDSDSLHNLGEELGREEIRYSIDGHYYPMLRMDDIPLGLDAYHNTISDVFIEKKPIEIVELRAPDEFGLMYSVINGSSGPGYIEKGHMYPVALPFKSSLKLTLDNKLGVINDVEWPGKTTQYSASVTYTYEEATTQNDVIEPVPISNKRVLFIHEPSFQEYVKVESDQEPLAQFNEGGVTRYEYEKKVDNDVTLTAQDVEGFWFSNWGGINESQTGRTLDLHLFSMITEVKPTFISNERLPSVIYVAPTALKSAPPTLGSDMSSPLGSPSNPYGSIEDAYAAASPGDELRLLPGEHRLSDTLVMDKSITISGGWTPGQEQQTFKTPKNGHGGPLNNKTVMTFARNDGNLMFDVKGCSVEFIGVDISFDSSIDDTSTVAFITSDSVDSDIRIELCTVEIMNRIGRGSSTGVDTSGHLEVIDSTFHIPLGMQVYGIITNVDSSSLIVERSDVFVGSDEAYIVSGIKNQTSGFDSRISDSHIRAVSNCPEDKGFRYFSSATAIAMENGIIEGNRIEAYSKKGARPISLAIAVTSGEDGGQLVLDNNIMKGMQEAQAESMAFLRFNGGALYFVNNIVDMEDTAEPQNIIITDDTSVVMCGNIFRSGNVGTYSNLVTLQNGPVLFVNNTLMNKGVTEDCEIPSAYLIIRNDEERSGSVAAHPAAVVNNLFIGGENTVRTSAVVVKDLSEFLVAHNAFIDFNEGNMLLTDGTDNFSKVESINERYGTGINYGEGIGEDIPDWNRNIVGLDVSGEKLELIKAPAAIRHGGYRYGQNDLMKMMNDFKLSLPLPVEYDFSSYMNDMYGNDRINYNSVGALQAKLAGRM